MRIKPAFRRMGYSYGLDWPLMAGEIKGFGGWAVWNKWTGRVIHWFPDQPNIHGWSPAKGQALHAAASRNEFNPFELDSVP
jgi:hypothetical protein